MNNRFSKLVLLVGLLCMAGMSACAIKPGDVRGKSVEWIDKTMQKREKLKMPVQQAAVQELAKIGDENAVRLLIDLSEDKDPTLRGEVALALGRIDDRDAVVRLIQMLGDSDSAVRRKSSSALQRQLDNAADASVAERMMREADINRDNVVTGTELGAFLRPTVSDASRQAQTPLYGRLEGEGEFLFFVTER